MAMNGSNNAHVNGGGDVVPTQSSDHRQDHHHGATTTMPPPTTTQQHQQHQVHHPQQHDPHDDACCLFVASYSVNSHITNSYRVMQDVHDCHLTIPVTVVSKAAAVTAETFTSQAPPSTTTAYYTATKVGSLYVVDPTTHQQVFLRRVLYIPDFDLAYPLQRHNQCVASGCRISVVVLFSITKSVEDGCQVITKRQHDQEQQKKRGKMKKTIATLFGRRSNKSSNQKGQQEGTDKASTQASGDSNMEVSSSTYSAPDWFEVRRDQFSLRFTQCTRPMKTSQTTTTTTTTTQPPQSGGTNDIKHEDNKDDENIDYDNDMIYTNVVALKHPPGNRSSDHHHHHHHHHHTNTGSNVLQMHLPSLASSLVASSIGDCSASITSSHSVSSTGNYTTVTSSTAHGTAGGGSGGGHDGSSLVGSPTNSKLIVKPGHRRTNSNTSAGTSGGTSTTGGVGGGGFSNGSASGATRGKGHRRVPSRELRF